MHAGSIDLTQDEDKRETATRKTHTQSEIARLESEYGSSSVTDTKAQHDMEMEEF
jgi:hypothetical protein